MLLIINAIFFTLFFLPNLQQYTPEFFSTNKHKKNFAKSFRALSKVYYLNYIFYASISCIILNTRGRFQSRQNGVSRL